MAINECCNHEVWMPTRSHLSSCPIDLSQCVFNQFNTTWQALHYKSSQGTKGEKEISGKISARYFSFGEQNKIDALWETEIGLIELNSAIF